jgi:DNA-binding CsgD family transcriptional regulator
LKPLSSREFADVQRAILALYSHRDLESFRRATPGIFIELVPADQFSLVDLRIDPRKHTATVLDVWESRPGSTRLDEGSFERLLADHPFTKHARKHGNTVGALRLSDFLTLAQLRKTALYREGLKPANVGRVLAAGSFGGPATATLSLTRPESDPDFSERDRRVFEALCPHFDQARANLERETRLRAGRTESLKACGMTLRETEVALWLAQGKSNHETAAILDTPVRTIEKHVERILRKLGVENRSSAAVAVAAIIRG